MATSSSPRPARRATPRSAPLRVVRPDDRVRTVGAIGSLVAGFFFVVMLALAGLHAVVVQTQAELDGVNADISALEEERVEALAARAWSASAIGQAETAVAAGFVPSARPAILSPVPPGALMPPVEADPFAGGAAG